VKMIMFMMAALLALAWAMPAPVEARERGYKSKYAKSHAYRSYYRGYRRPASVGPNGLCQRDTGTPTGSLNFRNRCDTEEFWNRQMQGGRRW
jgi:hypothetical protein